MKKRNFTLLAKFAGTDMAYMWFAILSWRRPLPITDNQRIFSHHRTTSWKWMVMVMVPLGLVEAFGLHVILLEWKPWVAWLHFGLATYSILWILGDWQALRHSVFHLGRDSLILQLGLRGKVEFPFHMVERIEFGSPPEPDHGIRMGEFVDMREVEGYKQLTALGEAELTIYLKEQVEVEGLFGIKSKATMIGISPDDVAGFAAALTEKLG